MSILQKWAEAVDSLNEQQMNECLHDDYKFTLHSAGKVLSKSDVIDWAMSGDIKRDNVRILFENDDVGFEHAFVSYKDGNKEAVMTYYKFKDGKVSYQETGATKLPK